MNEYQQLTLYGLIGLVILVLLILILPVLARQGRAIAEERARKAQELAQQQAAQKAKQPRRRQPVSEPEPEETVQHEEKRPSRRRKEAPQTEQPEEEEQLPVRRGRPSRAELKDMYGQAPEEGDVLLSELARRWGWFFVIGALAIRYLFQPPFVGSTLWSLPYQGTFGTVVVLTWIYARITGSPKNYDGLINALMFVWAVLMLV